MKSLFTVIKILLIIAVLPVTTIQAQIPTSGLRLHLKADTGTSTTTPGQKISQWNDQSGNGFHATEANTTWQPTFVNDGGIPAVRFNSSAPTDMNLPTPSTLGIYLSNYELFIVSKSSSSAVQFVLAGGINYHEVQLNGASGVRYIARLGYILDNPNRADDGSFHLLNAIGTTTEQTLGVDGNYVTSAADATTSVDVAFNLGTRSDGSYRLDGDIAEIIVYNRKLSTSESMQVSEYLKNKYSTAFTAYAAPATPASGLNFTSVTQNSMNVNLTKGSGSHRIVIAKKGSAVDAAPSNGVAYTGNATFGSGSEIGSGNFVVYAGTEGTTTALAGLDFSSDYHFAVYEYYLVGGVPQYGTAIVGNQSTPNLTIASNPSFSSVTQNSFTYSFTPGSGTHRVVIGRKGGAVNWGPTNGVTYTGNTVFGSGSEIGSGNFVVYAGTAGSSLSITGLDFSSDYYFMVFEYTLVNGVPKYSDLLLSANQSTPDLTVTSGINFTSVTHNSMTLNLTKGSGTHRIIVARAHGGVNANPVNGTSYTGNASYGNGSEVGTGNYVVYNGTEGTSVAISNIVFYAAYYYSIIEYTIVNGVPHYSSTVTVASQITLDIAPSSNVNLSNPTTNSLDVSLTKGAGTDRIVVARQGSAVNSDPQNLVLYGNSGGGVFGAGSELGTGNYAVYIGTEGENFTITGLQSGTDYHIAVYEYGYTAEGWRYSVPGKQVYSEFTQPSPASNFNFSSVGLDAMTLNFTVGTGQKRLVIAKKGQAVDASPVNGTSYTANANFGSGSELGTGNFVVYNGTGNSVSITGLENSSTYHFTIIEYSEKESVPRYQTISVPTTSQATTLVEYPEITNYALASVTGTSGSLSASINPNGYATSVVIAYGTESNNLTNFTDAQNIGTGSSPVNVDFTINGLTTTTTYYTQLRATNIRGTANSSELSFQTVQQPVVSLYKVTEIDTETPIIHSIVNPNSDATTLQVKYGTNYSNLNLITTSQLVGSQSTAQDVFTSLSGLTPNSLYYYQVVATNAGGTTESELGSFKYEENLSLPSLQFWASGDGASYTSSSGDPVLNWGNQSGNAKDAYQVNASNSPQRITDSGVSFLRFDGTDDFIEVALSDSLNITSNAYEVFIVARTSDTGIGFLMAGASEQYEIHTNPSGSTGVRFIPKTGTYLDNSVSISDGNFHIINTKATSTNAYLRLDGQITSLNIDARTSSSSNLLLGARRNGSYYFNGDIAEILVYNADLTNTQSWAISTYLSEKYAVSLTDFTPPSEQSTALNFIGKITGVVTISVNRGNGTQRLFVMRESGIDPVVPQQGVSYSPNPIYGNGSLTGTGNYVIGSTTDSTITVSGLQSDGVYIVDVYEYNIAGTYFAYNTTDVTSNYFVNYSRSFYSGKIPYVVTSVLDTNTGDGHYGTLRYVMDQINTHASDSTSLIDLRFVHGAILLGGELPPINYNLTIVGAGKDSVSINGNNTYRPFFIGAGTAPFTAENPATPTVLFEDFSITHGKGKGGDSYWGGGGGAGMGGALFLNDGSLQLSSIKFQSNSAVGGTSVKAEGNSGGGGGFSGNAGWGNRLGGSSGYLGGTNTTTVGQNGGIGAGGAMSGTGNSDVGGAGGFGAGGGSSNSDAAGSGGFGGGGGSTYSTLQPSFISNSDIGAGGFGAGYGAKNNGVHTAHAGGGGAGMGGAIFNRFGDLILDGVELNGNIATGGTGINNGSGLGGAIFNYQGKLLALQVTYGEGGDANSAISENNLYDYNAANSSIALASLTPFTSITSSSVVLNGIIQTIGKSGSYHWVYGTDPTNLSNSTSTVNYSGDNAAVVINQNLTGLTLSNMHYFKLINTNSSGTFETEIASVIYNNSIPADSLTMWLSAGNGIQIGSGSSITNWYDASGNANSATQSSSGYEPSIVDNVINGNPVVRFNGTSSYMVIDDAENIRLANSDYEIFVVAKSNSSALQFLFSGGIGEQEIQLNGASGLRFLPAGGKLVDAGTAAEYVTGEPFIFNVQATSTESNIRINNLKLGYLEGNGRSSYANQVLLGLRTGGLYYFNGDLAEIIVYNKALDVTSRNSVNSYLSSKYGITLGTVSEPTIAATNEVLNQRQTSSLNYSFSKGNGERRIVLAKANSAVDASPTDHMIYSANATFGSGAEIGSGNFVVYNGTDTTFTVTGLSSGTTYNFVVFEYNGLYESDYQTSSNLLFSAKTLNEIPDIIASNSLLFNGGDETVTIPHDAAFNADAITIEMWFKPQNVGSVPFLIAKANEELEIHLSNSNRSIRFIPTTGVYLDSPSNAFHFDEWNHVAVTYKPSESFAKMWVNGIEVNLVNNGSNPLSHAFQHSSTTVLLGQRHGFSLPLTGELDEVRIWNDVRTTEEVREFMFASIDSDFTNLITYFQFNEESGTSTVDAALGNDGTLSNFEFDANNGWRSSGISFGSGSFSATDAITSGTIHAPDLDITLTENFDNAVTVISKQFSVSPLVESSGNTINLNNPYWVVESSENSGAFEATLVFTVPENFVNSGTISTNQFKLYNRPFGSDGSWSLLKSTATSLNSNTITFEGVNQLGQFTLGRDVTYDFQANAGTNILFDGTNDFIQVPYSSSMDMQKITIEFWLKWNRSGTAVDFVISRGGEEWEVHLGSGSNGIRFIPRGSVYIDSQVEALTPSEWNHLAFVYDPSISLGKIYVNGQDLTGNTTNNLNLALVNSTNALNLGRRQVSGNLNFSGELDEFRVWNSARNQQQIQENMSRTLPDAYYSDLVMYFQFNEGSGTTTTEIQSGLTGTLTNFDFNQSSGWVNSLIPITQDISIDITLTGTEGWRLLSSPISANSFSPLLSSIWTQGFDGATTTSGSPNVYVWPNSATGNSSASWTPLSSMSSPMQAGSGVLVYVYSDDNGPTEGNAGFPKTISISGTETIEDKNLSALLNQNVGGWTLLGNPFSKDISWNGLSRNGLAGSVYVWDNEANQWRTWNGTTGGLANGHVGAFNGFFVETTSLNPIFTIPQNARVDGNNGFVGKASSQERIALALELKTESGLTNQAWFEFTEEGQTGKDDGDTYKLAPLSYEWAQLASVSKSVSNDDILLDVNTLPLEQKQWNIPLLVSATETGDMELSVATSTLPEGWKARIWDTELEQAYDLNEPFVFNLEDVAVSSAANTEEVEIIKDEARRLTGKIEPEMGVEPKVTKTGKFEVKASQKVKGKASTGPELQSASGANTRYVLQITKTDFNEAPITELPTQVELSQNYPNPFNPSTSIQFALPESQQVRLDIFDLSGRLVKTVVNEMRNAGYYTLQVNASALSSGMYFYRLTTPSSVVTKKMMLVK